MTLTLMMNRKCQLIRFEVVIDIHLQMNQTLQGHAKAIFLGQQVQDQLNIGIGCIGIQALHDPGQVLGRLERRSWYRSAPDHVKLFNGLGIGQDEPSPQTVSLQVRPSKAKGQGQGQED